MSIRCLKLALVGALLATPAVLTHDLFVNNRIGSDANDGFASESDGTGRGPCRSLTIALHRARTGDRIVVANTGVAYNESVTLHRDNNSGLVGLPFTIEGNGATLDGSYPVPSDQWEQQGNSVFRYSPRYKAFAQLFIGETPVERKPCDPLAAKRPDLAPRQWCLHRGAIYFCVDPDKTPHGYDLRFAALPVGITLYEVHNVVIKDLIVQGFRIDGVNAFNDVRGAKLVGLKCRGNGRSGISVGGSSRVEIETSLLGNNGVAQLRTEGDCIAKLVKSDLVGEDSAPAQRVIGGKLYLDGKLIK